MKIEIGAVSLTGTKNDISPTNRSPRTPSATSGRSSPDNNDSNQDRYFFLTNSGETESACIGIFDGHGRGGQVASEVAKQQFSSKLACFVTPSAPKPRDLIAYLKDSFDQVHQDIVNSYSQFMEPVNGKVPVVEYGTTATIVVVEAVNINNGTILVGCAGDSSAVLGLDDSKGGMDVEMLTPVHRATNPAEISRLNKDFPGKCKILTDGYLQPIDQFWWRHQVQLARSLGHSNLQKFGVIPTPSITLRPFEGSEMILIVATDGLWDNIPPKEAMEIAMNAQSAQQAAELLATRAQELAREDRRDDTTITVLFFLD